MPVLAGRLVSSRSVLGRLRNGAFGQPNRQHGAQKNLFNSHRVNNERLYKTVREI